MMNSHLPLLSAMALKVGYGSGRKKIIPVAGPLDMAIHAGQLICLLGPNGSGKSTLLRTLAGLQPALEGVIEIDGTKASKLKPAQLARKISLVLTDPIRHSNLTVWSLAALGRYPYSDWMGILSEADKAVVAWAIGVTGIGSLSDRKVSTLSDGESQKVMLARALAQDTPLMMLDEPTAHLDLPSRIQLMQLLHQLARHTNKGILISTHELDLALQVADEVWLLQAGGQLSIGAPEDLVLNGVFERVFDKEGILFDRTTGTFNMHQGNGKHIRLAGEGPVVFWTKRALMRQGFTVVANQDTAHSIFVSEKDGRAVWVLEHKGDSGQYDSIVNLLHALK